MLMRFLRTFVVLLTVSVGVAVAAPVLAGSCTFSCQGYTGGSGSSRGTISGGSIPGPGSPRAVSSSAECDTACESACSAITLSGISVHCTSQVYTATGSSGTPAPTGPTPSGSSTPTPTTGAPIAPDACGATVQALRDARDPSATQYSYTFIQPDWLCRVLTTEQLRTSASTCRSFSACTTLNSSAYCCPPSVGAPIGRAGAVTPSGTATPATTAPAATADAGQSGRLGLPPCATSHDPAIAGRCTLDDIKTVAVNFANFLMGLAAAFFLAIFVWAGFKYIFFAYDHGVAAEARKTLTGAAIGMLLVLGAATIVRFVQSAVTGGASISGSNTKAGINAAGSTTPPASTP